MRKLFIGIFVSLCIWSSGVYPLKLNNVAIAHQKPIPSYAKWGVLAMKKTQERYPKAQIFDYLHIGRTTTGKSSFERFKLLLKQNNKEFGVIITIEFDTKTEKIIKITFIETSV
ncbi:YqzG/YhdC family protein [Peribacillus alkalitolerans]|uniref:YqzG/YhdC family protein n=1 Tax=Peribacillus alkalitolerans TaxID=1550385 RepID=UPI0013D06F5A|nr:YqzG/YhdC family protein [Peribacillus alkalitolerans]